MSLTPVATSITAESLKQELGTHVSTPFIGENDKYNFVYLISCDKSDLVYIGKRTTITLQDDYKGSGARVLKHLETANRKEWIRTELAFFNTEREALTAESLLLRSSLVRANKHHLFNVLDYESKHTDRVNIALEMGMYEAYKHVVNCNVKFGTTTFQTQYFIDDEGNEWLRAKDAWHLFGGDKQSTRPNDFVRQKATKRLLELLSGQTWEYQHKEAAPVEAACMYSFSPSDKQGCFFIKPLFLKYCSYLSPEFELCVLSGDYSIV
jgi:hypothetical protein